MKARNKRHWVLIAYIVLNTSVLIHLSNTVSHLEGRLTLLEKVTTSQQQIIEALYGVLMHHKDVLKSLNETISNFWM